MLSTTEVDLAFYPTWVAKWISAIKPSNAK